MIDVDGNEGRVRANFRILQEPSLDYVKREHSVRSHVQFSVLYLDEIVGF